MERLPNHESSPDARKILLAFAKEAVDPRTQREVAALKEAVTVLEKETRNNPETSNPTTEYIEVVNLSDRQLKPLLYLIHGVVTALGDPGFERAGPYVEDLKFTGNISLTMRPQNLGTLVSISLHNPPHDTYVFSQWIAPEQGEKPATILRSALVSALDAAQTMQSNPDAVARWIKVNSKTNTSA